MCVTLARCRCVSRSHAWQAQMDARNVSVMRRQLAGRKSAAALDWLLKRQQERQQVEQEQQRYTVGGSPPPQRSWVERRLQS